MTKKLNQKGMSSILFAMVFIIILSLLSIGFATLVRRDQRESLDKTLSYQAQYAAESAINRKVEEIKQGTAATDEPNCQTISYSSTDPNTSASAEVTCITWKSEVEEVVVDSVSSDAYSALVKADGPSDNAIEIIWNNKEGDPNNVYPSTSSLPTVNSGNKPIIRVAYGPQNDISLTQVVYLVPSSGGGSYFVGPSDGEVLSTGCSGADECRVRLQVAAAGIFNSVGYYVSISSIGNNATVKLKTCSGNGSCGKIVGVQAEIDATAIAQDVIKRVRARVALQEQTYAGGTGGALFMSSGACKAYGLDGDGNDLNISGAKTANQCPTGVSP
jgi:Tfp pilus assembly protein PilX